MSEDLEDKQKIHNHLIFWKDFRDVFDQFTKQMKKYKKSFIKDGEKLVYMIDRKHKNVNYSLNEVFFRFTWRISAPYKSYKDNIQFEKDINEFKYHLENQHIHLIETHTHIEDLMSKNQIYRIYTNTIQQLINENHKIFEELLHILTVEINAETNDFIKYKQVFVKLCDKVIENLSIGLHIIYCNYRFNREVNYNTLEQIQSCDLQAGDLVLFDEYEYYTTSKIRKQVVFFTWTTILHAAIVYKKNLYNQAMIFQAGWDNRMKSYIENFEPISGVKYLILRYRKGLSKKEQKKMTKLIWKEINKKFSLLKMYGIAFQYWLIKFYNKWLYKIFPNITIGNNPFNSKWVFCSEVISIIYRKFHKNLGNYTDNAMIWPIDIFNSFELDIIGYIDDNINPTIDINDKSNDSISKNESVWEEKKPQQIVSEIQNTDENTELEDINPNEIETKY